MLPKSLVDQPLSGMKSGYGNVHALIVPPLALSILGPSISVVMLMIAIVTKQWYSITSLKQELVRVHHFAE